MVIQHLLHHLAFLSVAPQSRDTDKHTTKHGINDHQATRQKINALRQHPATRYANLVIVQEAEQSEVAGNLLYSGSILSQDSAHTEIILILAIVLSACYLDR